MNWSLLLLCAAATAVIAFAISALVGCFLPALRSLRMTAAAEARVLFGLALLLVLASIALMTAALAPSFGWMVDHCTLIVDVHDHPHLCDHGTGGLPAWTLLALGALLCGGLAVAVARVLHGAVAALATERALVNVSVPNAEHGVNVLPIAEPQAFVVGALRPEIFVTRGLLEYGEHVAPVLAHERAHVARRDPLRRLVASLALAFHLPGVARLVERRLARAHEMAADAEAARAMESPERVARALVRLARAQRRRFQAALAFAASDIEARVGALLDRRPKHDQPRQTVLLAGVALLCAIVAASADTVHHGIEVVLGFLG